VTGFLSAPSPGRVTAPWGAPPATPSSPNRHLGTDRGWGNGDVIYAMRDGIVKQTAYTGSYGNRTVIDHGIVAFGKRWETWYCHQSEFWVSPGQRVSRGQAIGRQGSTGNVTGKHLHSELRVDGVSVDQVPWENTPDPSIGSIEAAPAPVIEPPEEDPMYNLSFNTDGAGICTSVFGVSGVPTQQLYNLLYRLKNSNQLKTPFHATVKTWVPNAIDGQPERMETAEYDIVNGYLSLHRQAAFAGVKLDDAKLRSAISDALKGTVVTSRTEVDPEQLLKAFETVVPRVSAAMLRQAGAALTAAKP
jgi:hypothetical protein